MNNFKKAALTSLVLAGMAIGSAQAADPTQTLVWTGTVPGSTAGDTLLITGKGGSLNVPNGTITAQTDGTFTSSSIVLEAHANDGTATSPTIGDLTDATWSVASTTVAYGGSYLSPAAASDLIIYADGTKVTDLTDILGQKAQTVSLSVASKTKVENVEGEEVQVSVTIVASDA